ncbi:MAG: proton-conducting transporter membrane subunit [Desulfocapsaceae bacterium]|nr:proton-conducting transporter membrane subunit [Desulfocapsaceae bacterium]
MTAHLVITVVLVPILASIFTLFCGDMMRRVVCQIAGLTVLGSTCLIAYQTGHSRDVLNIVLSGWEAPLGIRLYLDGLSALLLLTTAIIAVCITFFAEAYFGVKARSGRLTFFWPLWFLVWAALNGLFLSGDVFNLYVTLEIINLAAVAMVALPRTHESLKAALNYLVIAFLGSLSYLFGVAILYTSHGTLDIQLLAELAGIDGPYILAAVLIFIGLMIKTALFPLHFWLPPAHASAPTPVSALLSGLVVTASAYMIIRLGFTVFAPLMHTPLTLLLGVLGGLAVLWGSVHALIQERVKMVVAYSTVAQLGYVFLALPVVVSGSDLAAMVWYGVLYFVICHACAKTAAFLAAGTLINVVKHDRIAQLSGAAQHWPMVFMAFGMAGVNLIGLPPSGGFIGKWLMLQAMINSGQWLLVLILIAGSLLAAGYIFRVLGIALQTSEDSRPPVPAPLQLTLTTMILAVLPLLLGVFSQLPFSLLAVGSPFGALP